MPTRWLTTKFSKRRCGILYLNDIQIGVGQLHSVKQLANYCLQYLKPFITNEVSATGQ